MVSKRRARRGPEPLTPSYPSLPPYPGGSKTFVAHILVYFVTSSNAVSRFRFGHRLFHPVYFLWLLRCLLGFEVFISPIPLIVLALPFSLPPSRNSDPGSHSRLFSPPTHYVSCFAFVSREYFISFFPRRLASVCGALISNCAVARAQHSGNNGRFAQQPPRGWFRFF